MSESGQHAQVAQTLKRWVKPLPRNNNGLDMKMDLAKCDASLPEQHDSISAVSTALPSPATSFGEGSDEGTTHHVVQDLDSWIAQQTPERNPISGKLRDEEQERKVLPRTSSECSEFWTRIQEESRETGARSRAASTEAASTHSTDYDFRPRTPTVLNEYYGEYREAAPFVCTAMVPDESELLRRNSELEDRVAELERKLLELAAQKGVA